MGDSSFLGDALRVPDLFLPDDNDLSLLEGGDKLLATDDLL